MSLTVLASDPVPDDVGRLLRDLPEWFGIEEAVDGYVAAAQRLPTHVARDDDGVTVGVCLVEHHGDHTSEIHLLAVQRDHHRRGIGRALMAAVEEDLAADGREFVQVKTLGPSDPSPEYAATRRFYASLGYRHLEEFPADSLWPGNPCLVMVRHLGDRRA